jgi:hypothetical protein
MSVFDQPVTLDMGCSLIDICSISVLFLSNCIVKPFISFTPSVSGTTLSVPSVYFISICIYNGFPIYGIVEMDNIHTLVHV